MNLPLLAAEARATASEEFRIAAQPRVWGAPGTEHVNQAIDWGMPDIIDFMDDHGVDGADLQSMAIYAFPQKNPIGPKGVAMFSPQIIQNEIYYPVIKLAVPPNRMPQQWQLNLRLRHELRHVMQDDNEPLYTQPWARWATRAAGVLATAYGIKQAQEGDTSWLPIATMSTGPGAVLAPGDALYALSLCEMDARIFSYTNAGFNPIRVSRESQVGVTPIAGMTAVTNT